MPRKASDLTVTDQFCGAGGSSIGAASAGLRIRMAMNHWKLAVETHNTNFPDTDHDTCDISAADVRRYPSTDILITSPECTSHSPAGGNRHRKPLQRDLFIPSHSDAATQRSRATMWDVVRFAEYHQYRGIVVENVVEAVRCWPLFWDWFHCMEKLGYVGKIVSLNSMHAHPTPQSRDRIYIVFTKRANRRPDLDLRFRAPCATCGDVEAKQAWKAGRQVGKYGPRNQYVYTCPNCHAIVTPYYFCALNAIDFSIPAERIGDRERALKASTLARIRHGLSKYGRRHLYVARQNVKARGLGDAIPALVASANQVGLVGAPWLVGLSQGSAKPASMVRNGDGPFPAKTTADDLAVAGFTPFMVTQRTNANGKGLDDPLPSLCTGQHHALISPAALLRIMGPGYGSDLDAPARAVTGGGSDALVAPSPFLIQYYGQGGDASVDRSIPTVTVKDRHALIEPRADVDVEDCYFRMLVPDEVGAAMAFPSSYVVLGKKGERIKQYGNAVTPPAMSLLVERVMQSIIGERVA